jgi:hypothetical protein
MKTCKKCNVEKNESEFHKCKISKDGLYGWCKNCKREYDKKYRNSEKVQDYQHSECLKAKKIAWKDENFLERKIMGLKFNMRTRNLKRNENLTVTITKNDLESVKYCPLLGVELSYKTGKSGDPNTAAIDRIDNLKGYDPGNVWILSAKANFMKSSASKEELITFAENILKIFKKNE